MRSLVVVASALFATACMAMPPRVPVGHPEGMTPGVALIDRIESMLAEDPCIGSLDRWARYYKMHRGPDGLNRDLVDIELRQAGVFGFRRGRYVLPAPDRPLGVDEIIIIADDRRHRVAFGSYEAGLDRLTIDVCTPKRS